MRLSSLRLFGFKTFAEQTVLSFEPGITAIVGPNGSGKSNLVDAIRWVLGEQSPKSLRSTKTEDVIFAGNDRRKPLGMTEVTLTFRNDEGKLAVDATEVAITRRADRAGESEFFINRQSVRLRDVVELFMGTGLGPGSYAIVSQGQVDAILAAKPAERRSLFDETAGINKFLARKAESMRRLEQTERNGIRLGDVLAEIQTRVPELEAHVRRARRYRKMSARVRDLEILAYLRATVSRRNERERLQAELEALESDRLAATARCATAAAELLRARGEFYDCEVALEALRGEATRTRAAVAEREAEQAAQEARREALQAQAGQLAGDCEQGARERADLLASLARLDVELELRGAEVESARERERAAQRALADARAQLESSFAALRELEAVAAAEAAAVAERRAQTAALQSEYARLQNDIDTFRRDAHRCTERAAELACELSEARAQEASLEERADRARIATKHAEERAGAAADALTAAQAAYRAATGELAGAEARLHTIEELEANLEGHVPGTRAVLDAAARGEFDGIVGVVSNLVSVDEPYARALDIAFGPALSNVVTETAEDAERAIAFLRVREAGRATFLPLDTLGGRVGRDPEQTPRGDGIVGYAHTLVEPVEPRFAGIVAFLIGRILVVESLDVGIDLVRGQGFHDAIVTLEGDEIRGGGAITGGRYKRERAILSRRAQARMLSQAMASLRDAVVRAERAASAAREAAAEAASQRDDAHRSEARLAVELHDAKVRVGTLESERTRAGHDAARLLERAEERKRDGAAACERLRVLKAGPDAPRATPHERERLEAKLVVARAAVAAAEEAERRVASEIAASRESLAALVGRKEGMRTRLELLDASDARAGQARAAMAAELDALRQRVAAGAAALEGFRNGVESADERERAAVARREQLYARTLQLESTLQIAQDAEREASTVGAARRVRLAEIDAELKMLAASFAQNPATAAECADVEQRYEREQGDPTAELGRLRDDLGRLQNVNLNAQNEIAELAERERFLRAQLDDLSQARETLLESIREIEASSQIAFNQTFAEVQAAFEDVYERLVPGGVAKMWQTDPEHLSETGIELSVQPPGKKMMALAALSGGERAMAASALIFALIRVKPSPFYLLDEVDAALDEENIGRFSRFLRELGTDAQLLLVTHNKKTMELAEHMYGVTMSEPGISRVIGTDLLPVAPEADKFLEPALA